MTNEMLAARIDALDALLRSVMLQNETMLTMQEAARLVGLCEDKFRRTHTRLVPSYRVGKRLLFKKSELVQVLEGYKRLDVGAAARAVLTAASEKRGVA